MFVPITMLCRVRDRAEAVQLANDFPVRTDGRLLRQ
jgi:hypothetical protein